jgi:hypothetical protein
MMCRCVCLIQFSANFTDVCLCQDVEGVPDTHKRKKGEPVADAVSPAKKKRKAAKGKPGTRKVCGCLVLLGGGLYTNCLIAGYAAAD